MSVASWIMWLRTKKSKDDTSIAHDKADQNRVAWLEIRSQDAEKKADTYLEGLRKAEVLVERQAGMIQHQQEQIEAQAEQISAMTRDKAEFSLKLSAMLLEMQELRKIIIKENPELARQMTLSSEFGRLGKS